MDLNKAKEVAAAKEFSGDIRVNFLNLINAASVLLKEVKRLERECNTLKEDNKYLHTLGNRYRRENW